MKKFVAVATILTIGSLFADVGANTFGVLRVDSNQPRTIVAIPWIQASLTNGEITVADVVKTANLNNGDTLHYYNSEGNFESWKLVNSSWTPAVEADLAADVIEAGTAAGSKVLSRGNALILIRKTDWSGPFYLWGQVASSTAGTPTTSITPGAYNLIAPPVTNSVVDINKDATWSGGDSITNDYIYINVSTNETIECRYRKVNESYSWQEYVTNGTETVGDITIKKMTWKDVRTIKVGTGFWYKADADSEAKVTWNGIPQL